MDVNSINETEKKLKKGNVQEMVDSKNIKSEKSNSKLKSAQKLPESSKKTVTNKAKVPLKTNVTMKGGSKVKDAGKKVTVSEVEEELLEIEEKAESIMPLKRNSLVIRNKIKDNVKKAILRILPFGKSIEKIYLIVLAIIFVAVCFKSSALITEDKVLLFCVSVSGLFLLRSFRRKIQIPRVFVFIYGSFLAFSLIINLFSVNLYNSLLYFLILVTAGFVSIIGYDVVYGKYSRRWLLNTMSASLAVIAVYSIYIYSSTKTTLTSPLGFPVYIGTLLLSIFPFVFSSLLKTNGVKKVMFFAITSIFLVSMVLTFEKFIYIIALLQIIVVIFVNLNIKKILQSKITILKSLAVNLKNLYFILSALLISMGGALLLKGPKSGTVTFDPANFTDRYISTIFRKEILVQGWNMLSHFPLTGIGLGNFRIMSVYFETHAWDISYYLYNDILQMFVSEGVIGGILFLAFIGYILYIIFNKRNLIFSGKIPDTLELALGILSIMLVSFFFPVLHVIPIIFVLFLFIGLLLKLLKVEAKLKTYLKRYYFLASVLICMLVIVSGIYVYAINYLFIQLQGSVSSSNVSSSLKQMVQLSSLNPIDWEYPTIISQVYLDTQDMNNAIKYTQEASKFNKKYLYIYFNEAYLYYLEGNTKKALSLNNSILSSAKYSDPSFYLLPLSVYKQENKTQEFNKLINTAIKYFPVNYQYNTYSDLFNAIGYSASLAELYIEYGKSTNNSTYILEAEKLDPSLVASLLQSSIQSK